MNENAKAYYNKILGNDLDSFKQTDPEFSDFFSNFVFDEVVNQNDMDDKTRGMVILATLLGCQGIDAYKHMVKAALNLGVTPVEVKEITYQATAYLGIGRTFPFLNANNEVLKEEGIELPLEGQSTTNPDTRLVSGNDKQVELFGPQMKESWKSAPEESAHINIWLADNCFGDYYTRKGLDNKQREMITFCFLAAQGGVEPQLTSHAGANLKNGNDYSFMINVISEAMPYIGYPRTLNALRCLNEAKKSIESK